MRLDCQVAALSEGVVKRQIEFDEKAQSLSAMVSITKHLFSIAYHI